MCSKAGGGQGRGQGRGRARGPQGDLIDVCRSDRCTQIFMYAIHVPHSIVGELMSGKAGDGQGRGRAAHGLQGI